MLAKFQDLKGHILMDIKREKEDDAIIFTLANGDKYQLYHEQDCCERVVIEDIDGDLSDLVGSPILIAEEVTSNENPPGITIQYQDSSFTWTFYKLATAKGYVTIRWYGDSNGYYSEKVDWKKVEEVNK